MSKYLADTTVVIEMLRGNLSAKNFLENRPAISAVTAAELIQGVKNKQDLLIVEKTLTLLPPVTIDTTISQTALELLKHYHLSHGLLFLDALIAATAIVKKLTLVTANLKDFKYIEKLQLADQQAILNS